MSDLFDLFDEPFEEAEPEPVEPAEPVVPARRVRTVTQLTVEIRDRLESDFGEVWVEGEISNCRTWNTGHVYFTLKDRGAQLKAVMFRSAVRYLRFRPEDGLHVVARGRVTVYEPKGEYQLACEHLEPHGLGARQLAFDQLKRRLQAEGLFDAARKRPLPLLPRTVGVVTSMDGAALRDIIKVLRRRYPNIHLIVRPTRVQGDGAAADVAAAIRAFGGVDGVDVLIVGRGGGSVEDLWAFNEEPVARAIARCPIPVISAVGHEIDVTIADLVADLRAPTPSAAAEMVVARKDEFCGRIERLESRARLAVQSRLRGLGSRLHFLSGRPGLAGWPARLAMRGRQVAELSHDLRRVALAGIVRRDRRYQQLQARLELVDPRRRVPLLRGRLLAADAGLAAGLTRHQDRRRARLESLAGRLHGLSPLAVLARGYAVCWNEDRSAILRDAADVQEGAAVQVTLSRGELACEVRGRRPAGPHVAGSEDPST